MSIGPIKRGDYLDVRVWAQEQARKEKQLYLILRDKGKEDEFYACPYEIAMKHKFEEFVQIVKIDGIIIEIGADK